MSTTGQKKRLDKHILKIGLLATVIVAVLLLATYWIVAENWAYCQYEAAALSPNEYLPALNDGDVVEQVLYPDGTNLNSLTLYASVFQPDADGVLKVQLLENQQVIFEQALPIQALVSMGYTTIDTGAVAFSENAGLVLRLTCQSSMQQVMTLYYGSTVMAGKIEVPAAELDQLTLNGVHVSGRLSSTALSYAIRSVAAPYLYASLAIIALCAGLTLWLAWKRAHDKASVILLCFSLANRYSFLVHQLVARDFNTKYRRSVLGVMWSFLNPLLTMSVQYLVFSTLFTSSIPYFSVYLMTGIILFNFFSESVGLGLDSIVTSAGLINKVYMPKLIFPISRVLSSLINLLISFAPLLLMILATGMPVHSSILLLPIIVVLLTLFCFGMSFILATANVFFRDTRFLWGVVVLLWTYLTPIFYPESIIPAKFLMLYHMNPMYQFIYFLRTITIGGVAPSPMTFLYCLLAAVVPLLIGIWIFRKHQQKFVLYL